VLLVIALIALLLGILCLYLEMDMYEWKIKGGPTVSADRPAAVAMASDQGPGAGDRQCTLRPRSAWLPPPHRNC
jgi:hypothetical protein